MSTPELTEDQKKALLNLMQGQIWEECEICGEEPVYLPHFRCESCLRKWVTGRGRK
jgi:hypothetical protein